MEWEAVTGSRQNPEPSVRPSRTGGHWFPLQPRRVQEHSVSHSLAASHPCCWQEPAGVSAPAQACSTLCFPAGKGKDGRELESIGLWR